ncbi:MAG: hypothetical protein UZ03_NOB001003124 [Nitrospira sp. OLB3]|nr:MAG: hypothetical protein UZ03_NOB001003124 [Nitrospira sp. OLB3]
MITRIFICILVTLFLLTAEQSATRAADKLTITMKVTAHGLQVSGIAMQNKRIMIPRAPAFAWSWNTRMPTATPINSLSLLKIPKLPPR